MSDDSPADERRVSPVGIKTLFKSKKKRNFVLVAVAGGAAIFVLLGINAAVNLKGDGKPDDTGSTMIGQVTQGPPVPAIAQPKALPAPVTQAPAPTPTVVAAAADYVRFPASGGDAYFTVPPPKAHDDKPTDDARELTKPSTGGKTEVAFKPSTLAGGKAGPAIRLTYVMTPQMIPCALDTAMDSTLAGAISCHTTQDVLSPDHVLLMPAGTAIVGTYKNTVANGQHRLFAFAGNAITQEGIPVPLASEVADGVGRAGIEGDVDNHYAERFGAAILLTLADGGLNIAQAEVSKAGDVNVNVNGGSGLGGVANQILQSQINIPPTITVPPGTIVSIVVDHLIDFSDALRVSPVER